MFMLFIQSPLCRAALLLALALPRLAGAQEAAMQADMRRYYEGEREGGIWLMSVGAPALAGGAGLLAQGNSFGRGVGYPLLVMGAMELVGGVSFFLSSKRRVPRFSQDILSRPAAFREEELKHLRRIDRDMRLLEATEISLILAGGTLTGIGALENRDRVTGIGTGMMLQTAVLLIYDQLAGRRARRYLESLTRFTFSRAAGGGATVAMMQRF